MTIQIRITPATLILSLCAAVALVPALTRAYIDPNDLFNSPIMGGSTSSDPCGSSTSSSSLSQGSASSIDYLGIIPFGQKVSSSASSFNYLAIIPFGQPVSSASSLNYLNIIPFGTVVSSASSTSANPCSSSSAVSTSSSSRSSSSVFVAGTNSSAGSVQYVNNGAGGKTRIIVKEPTYVTNEAPMRPFPVTVPVETHAAGSAPSGQQLPQNTQTVQRAGGGNLQASILDGQTNTTLHSGAPTMTQSGPGSVLALLLVLIASAIVIFRIPQKTE